MITKVQAGLWEATLPLTKSDEKFINENRLNGGALNFNNGGNTQFFYD